jgi:hypothetical protein
MRRWMLAGMLLSLLFASTVYAHVAGSFGDFLLGVKDERTTEKLKNEIKETKEEIERLTPRVEKLEAEYSEKAEVAVSKLQFYTTIGLDTYMNFILQSDDIVDILANQRLVEKKMEEDLRDLNQLYMEYMPLKLAKDSLEGHVELLNMIQDNLQARKKFLSANEDLTPEEVASIMVINWAANAGSLDEILLEDSKLLNQQIGTFVTQKTDGSPYRLEEKLFNQKSKLTYYFRSDHVYVHHEKEDTDIILIGTVSKADQHTVALDFEAGFLNGVLLSGDLLNQLPGFQLDYSNLNPHSKGFYVEQINGAIVIQPAEQAVE